MYSFHVFSHWRKKNNVFLEILLWKNFPLDFMILKLKKKTGSFTQRDRDYKLTKNCSHPTLNLWFQNLEVTKSLHDISHLGVDHQHQRTSAKTTVRSSRAASASGRTSMAWCDHFSRYFNSQCFTCHLPFRSSISVQHLPKNELFLSCCQLFWRDVTWLFDGFLNWMPSWSPGLYYLLTATIPS